MAVLTINTCGGQCRGIWEVETRHAIRQPTVHRMPPSDPQVHVGVRNPCHCRGLFTQATVTPDIRVVSAPTPGTARQSRPGSAVILLPHLGSLANPRALEPLPESPATLKRGFCPSWEPAPSLTGGIWGDAPVVTGVSPRPLGPPAALLGGSRRVPLPLPQNSSPPAGSPPSRALGGATSRRLFPRPLRPPVHWHFPLELLFWEAAQSESILHQPPASARRGGAGSLPPDSLMPGDQRVPEGFFLYRTCSIFSARSSPCVTGDQAAMGQRCSLERLQQVPTSTWL